MKFALNHKWKFKRWRYAFFVGFTQMSVVFFVQLVNLGLIYSDGTALDIIKDFVSLIIIAELDDFYFMTVKEERLGQLINRGSIKLDDKILTLSELTKIETTSSEDATAQVDGNKLIPLKQELIYSINSESKDSETDTASAVLTNNSSKDDDDNFVKIYDIVEIEELKAMREAQQYIHMSYTNSDICFRRIYKFFKIFYGSVWFFFVPFLSLYLPFCIL